MQKELKSKKYALLIMAILIIATAGIFSYLSYKIINNKKLITIKHAVVVDLDKKNSDPDNATMKRKIIIQCISTFLILSALLLIFFAFFYNFKVFWLWCSVIFFSLLLCMGIIIIWYLEINSSLQPKNNMVTNDQDVEKFFIAHKKENPHIYIPEPHFLPMGFLFYSIEINKEIISLYGYPWVKKDTLKDSNINGTVFCMNALEEKKIWISQMVHYNHTDNFEWQLRLKIHADFDYTKYPFDHQNITLLFEHEETLKKVILAPDFKAYKEGITSYPPLADTFNMSGWAIKNAYFFYELSDYSTDFGHRDYWQVKNFPFLSYTIQIQRKFIEPLFTSLIPIVIILFITFACLLMLSSIRQNINNIRLILALLSSLFFASILAYGMLQEVILTPNITYLKSFYIMTHIIIFLVTANTVLYMYQYGKIIAYKNNLIIRLLYWPITLTIFFVTTLLFFY